MEMIAPSGPVYQAGTLSGNPLALAAGIETLQIIDEDEDFYKRLEETSSYLERGSRDSWVKLHLNFTFNRCGSMFTLYFTERLVTDFDSAKTSDTAMFTKYFNKMLEQGVYLPPSQFEACFVSIAHERTDIDKTIAAAARSFG